MELKFNEASAPFSNDILSYFEFFLNIPKSMDSRNGHVSWPIRNHDLIENFEFYAVMIYGCFFINERHVK